MASFYVIRGRDSGQHFAIRGAFATIGREATNQIQLRDTEVSRRHARVVRTDQSNFQLIDNNSSNGTYVNNKRTKSHLLKSGDRIQIGKTLLVFTGGPEPHSTRSIDSVEIVADQHSHIRSAIESHSALVRPPASVTDPSASSVESRGSDSGFPSTDSLRQSDLRNLDIVFQVSQAINRTVDLGDLLAQVLDLIFKTVSCERGCILMVDDTTGQLAPISSMNRSAEKGESKTTHLSISRTILDHVRSSKEAVLTSNAQDDERWQSAESVARLGIHEAMCAPMLGRYGFVGAIYVDTSLSLGEAAAKPGAIFNEDHLKLLSAIAGQAALAIEDTQFYRAMMQSERLAVMGQTIANLSHHVKNILQGVSGGNYLVEEAIKKQDWDVLKKGWGLVERNQERISQLVMDMLSYSKDREPDLNFQDLRFVIDEIVHLLKSRATDEGVAIKWVRPEDPFMANFDTEGIHRALLNVVSNAVDAVGDREGGVVEIEVTKSDDMVQITVMDNGPGIEPQDEKRIFQPFESTKGSGGTGLGLPVSQKIMREHGGDLNYRTKVGEGTAFILYWPGEATSSAARATLMG